jgi:hypothetical protein
MSEDQRPSEAVDGCCGTASQATHDRPRPSASENTPCCGTPADAVATGSCCGATAKTAAVASGAGCCK